MDRLKDFQVCGNSILRNMIVFKIKDPPSQPKTLLKERDLTLIKYIDICKAAEKARIQSRALRNETQYKETVNKVMRIKSNKLSIPLRKLMTKS